MIEFAGWSMPVQYTGLIEEHHAVRRAAGLFDLSHMGRLRLQGPGSLGLIQRLATLNAEGLAAGRAHYTMFCNENGGIVDDLLIYRLEDNDFLLVTNAATAQKDLAWLKRHAEGDVRIADKTESAALLALQGPAAADTLAPLLANAAAGLLDEMKPFAFARCEVGGRPVLLSRTGYTGEDGFELYAAASDAEGLWRLLIEAGKERGALPAGLGARDTLRLEARLLLYGQDIDEESTPLEAGLGRFIDWGKGPFVGKEALERQREEGPKRRLAGFVLEGRGGAPRTGYTIHHEGQPVGRVTSGRFSPTLEQEIGLGYVPAELAEPGTEIEVEIRGRLRPGRVIAGRFLSQRRP